MPRNPRPEPRNVLVVACNAWHIGFLGAYGNPWIHTPNIDRLAADGVVFDWHFPENLTTLPTRRTWWTGRHGFPDPARGWTPLATDERLLPEWLAARGVRTAFISDNPLLREPGYGYGRGFDEVVQVRGRGYDPFIPPDDPRGSFPALDHEPRLRLPDRNPDDPEGSTLESESDRQSDSESESDDERALWEGRWSQYLRNRAVLGLDRPETAGAVRLVEEAVRWLERRGSGAAPEPFFLWIDMFDPHGPWDPPAEFRDRYATYDPSDFLADEEGDLVEFEDEPEIRPTTALIDVPPGFVGEVLDDDELERLRKTYAGAAAFADHALGRLFETLARLGRLDDTLVVFTADQGEPLGERGYVRRALPGLYEELVHTPLILRFPGAELAGTRSSALVSTVDLTPTIVAALGLPPWEEAVGLDLAEIARGVAPRTRDHVCMGMDAEVFAIRTRDWHLILPVAPDPETGVPPAPELYRKPEDRWERNNVLAQHPHVADHLELALRRFADLARNPDAGPEAYAALPPVAPPEP